MRFFIILIFTFYVTITTSQINGVVKYKKTIHIPESTGELDINLKQSLNNISPTIENFSFDLVFNNKHSKYYLNKVLSNNIDNELNEKLAIALIGGSSTFFCDNLDKVSINEIDNFGEKLLITNKIQENEWVLLDESKTVIDNTLFKAKLTKSFYKRSGKTTKEIIAWYNPSINIPFGPDGYFGLPGLIFELVDGNITTYLQSINFVDDEIEIQFPTKGKKMNDEEFYEYTKELFNKHRN